MNILRSNITTATKKLTRLARSYRHEPSGSIVAPESLVDPKVKKDWTVLTYLEGRDRLSNSVDVALNGMEQIGSTDRVNIVAQATMVPEFGDRLHQHSGQVNTRRLYLKKDDDVTDVTSPVLKDFGEQVRLDPSNLEDFLAWGMEKFPAQNYMVIVKKHGLGFAQNGGSVPISAREMRETLENVEQRTGIEPDVLSWDSCSMQQMEVAYELKDRAKVVTGSPEVIRAVEYPYPTLMHNLTKFASQQTPETVGQTVVAAYGSDAQRTSQSAISLEKMGLVGERVRNLVDNIFEADVPRDILYTNMMNTGSMEPRESLALNFNFRDFAGFLENLSKDKAIESKEVKKAARDASKALEETELMKYLPDGVAKAKGLSPETSLSSFLPWKEPSEALKTSYSELAWSKDTGWDRLLNHVLENNEQPEEHQSSQASMKMGLGKMALYGYKKFVSPYHLSACPYDPSCSQYARTALEHHGVWEGSKMAFMRVLSCQGTGAGGKDSVPHQHHEDHIQQPLPDITLQPPKTQQKSPLRKKLELKALAASRVAGKLVGGTIAGLAGGVTGAVLGAVWGQKAGIGSLGSFNEQVRKKYGEHKTDTLQKVQKPLIGAGAKVKEVVEGVTKSETLGKIAGSVSGAVSGGCLGLIGGGIFGFKFLGDFAALGLQNAVKNQMGELPTHLHTEKILLRDYTAGDDHEATMC